MKTGSLSFLFQMFYRLLLFSCMPSKWTSLLALLQRKLSHVLSVIRSILLLFIVVIMFSSVFYYLLFLLVIFQFFVISYCCYVDCIRAMHVPKLKSLLVSKGYENCGINKERGKCECVTERLMMCYLLINQVTRFVILIFLLIAFC